MWFSSLLSSLQYSLIWSSLKLSYAIRHLKICILTKYSQTIIITFRWTERRGSGQWRRGITMSLTLKPTPFQFPYITKTCLFKHTENFTTKKWKFSDKTKSDIFHISAQNIDCRYSLEPPRRGGSNEYRQSMFLSRNKKIMYTPVNPSFTI